MMLLIGLISGLLIGYFCGHNIANGEWMHRGLWNKTFMGPDGTVYEVKAHRESTL